MFHTFTIIYIKQVYSEPRHAFGLLKFMAGNGCVTAIVAEVEAPPGLGKMEPLMECLTSILQEQVGAELVNFRCQKKFFWQKQIGKIHENTGGLVVRNWTLSIFVGSSRDSDDNEDVHGSEFVSEIHVFKSSFPRLNVSEFHQWT